MSRTLKLKLTLQYVGTGYSGWQLQPGSPTIQGTVERALAEILDEAVRIDGAGRTDAGVHARGQVASVSTGSGRTLEVIHNGVNGLLPWDIRVIEVVQVAAGFHARTSAVAKEYRYEIWNGDVMPPFLYPLAAHVRPPMNAEAFQTAARSLLGRHDFTAFVASGGAGSARAEEDGGVDTFRRLMISELIREGNLWIYRVVASGFMRKMVRTIAGTLIEIARGRWEPGRIEQILESRDRSAAGPTAPPQGLYLERVLY